MLGCLHAQPLAPTLRLTQYVGANFDRYNNTQDQILFAGSLLKGLAGTWYEALVDPITYRISPSYSFESFLQELDDFFGGGVNVQTLERSLINLRQTGTVSELAIAFQNITNTFRPKWPDHPLIFIFSQKLKEVVRFELTGRGSPPSVFQAYVTAAIAVELNQAAAHSSRGGSQLPLAPRPLFQPYAKANPAPPPPVCTKLPPPPPPWRLMPPAASVVHSPKTNAAAGLTQGSAGTVASRAMPSIPAPTVTRPGALSSFPPVSSSSTSPNSLAPGNNFPPRVFSLRLSP